MVGWVLFRAESLPQALSYVQAMVDWRAARPLPVDVLILLNAERLAAMAAGIIFAAPVLPWLLDRARAPRLAGAQALEPRLDTQGVHVLATPVLIAGLILSIAVLAGTTLNPFLYFRF